MPPAVPCLAPNRGPIGAFRDCRVFVGGHTPPAPASVPYMVEEICAWLNGPGKESAALVSSAILHYQFEHIHPFGDGNGRVGRALATWELYRKQFHTNHIFAVDKEAPRGIQEIISALKVTKPGAHFMLKPLLDAGLLKRTGGQ